MISAKKIPEPAISTREDHSLGEWFLAAMVSSLEESFRTEGNGNGIQAELEIFLRLPYCRSVSLFLIRPQTYEFIHHLSCPEAEGKKARKQFSGLVFRGRIAQALNAAQGFASFPLPHRRGNGHLLILPLFIPSEIIGILLLETDRAIEDWEPNVLQLCRLQARQLAYTVSHKNLSRQLRNQKTLLRQKITERTVGLEKSQRELKTILDSVKAGILIIDRQQRRVINANQTALELTNQARESLLGAPCSTLCRSDHQSCPLCQSDQDKSQTQWETSINRSDGSSLPVIKTAARVVLGGRPCIVESFIDLSDQKELESQFLQSQKLEAVGRLAGGVAHDFNNLLMAIMGYCDLALTDLKADVPTHHYVEEIAKAADRAVGLTRQLLALSRKQVQQPTVLDLNAVILDIKKMLLRIIGEDIVLTTRLENRPGLVKADKGQLEQVIMNLTINARDAMPKGGKLIFETSLFETDRPYLNRHPVVRPGSYVVLTVSDNGEGMTKETQDHIFEPFFTTKEVGLGTGLGLSTVYGIIKQSSGFIWVYSELGRGTTLKIYLPRVSEPKEEPRETPKPSTAPRGSETILLIEDEPMLRTSIKESLETFGYLVLDASDGDQAMKIARRSSTAIHLILTDLIMPGKSGRETAEMIIALHPESEVLYMSGYTNDMVIRNGLLQEKTAFLQKPFTPTALAIKVREILDRRSIC
ncbi:MAG: ATP-binding protein [Thermodesulfobacteriota bacterium]